MALTACVVMTVLFPHAAAQEQAATSIRIAVASDGSAHWTVEHTLFLSTPADEDAWNQTYASDRDAFLGQFRENVTASVERAAQVTGWAMAATDFELNFRVLPSPITGVSSGARLGVFEYAFTWQGFTAVGGGVIMVGDAFVDGYYLQAKDALYLSPPAGYAVAQTSPSADAFSAGAAVWLGSVDTNPDLGMRLFNPGFPQARIEPSSTTTTGAQTAAPPGSAGSTALLMGGAAGILAIIVVAGGLSLRGRRKKVVELPGDREMLLALLRQAGGQAYQSDLVAATGFSEAKVSLLLKQMHREGVVVKVRRGNRNVIRLR